MLTQPAGGRPRAVPTGPPEVPRLLLWDGDVTLGRVLMGHQGVQQSEPIELRPVVPFPQAASPYRTGMCHRTTRPGSHPSAAPSHPLLSAVLLQGSADPRSPGEGWVPAGTKFGDGHFRILLRTLLSPHYSCLAPSPERGSRNNSAVYQHVPHPAASAPATLTGGGSVGQESQP